MVKRRGPPSQGWLTFLRNHVPPKVIAGIKFQNGIEVIKMPAHHAA
jgi:hypothetical protein